MAVAPTTVPTPPTYVPPPYPGTPDVTPPPPPSLINDNAQPTATPPPPVVIPDTPAAPAVGYDPDALKVTDEQTVQGQIGKIIKSGSPLMEQAEANARRMMNTRGLINSTAGVNAGQTALYTAATPIATADAKTYADAATNTYAAENRALEFTAGAKNTAAIENAKIISGESMTAAQIQGSTNIAKIQGDTQKYASWIASDASLSIAERNARKDEWIAAVNANTTLSAEDKRAATALITEAAKVDATKFVANINASTTLSAEDKRNRSAEMIAYIQADSALDVEGKKQQTAIIVQGMISDISKEVANINARGDLDVAGKQGETAKIVAGINARGDLDVATAQALSNQAIASLQDKTANKKIEFDWKASQLNNQTQITLERIQQQTNLTVADKQAAGALAVEQAGNATDKMIAGMNITATEKIQAREDATRNAIAKIQANNALDVQTKANLGALTVANANNAAQTGIANIQKDTQLTVADKNNATARWVQSSQAATQQHLAWVQQQTSFGTQERANAGNKAVAEMNYTTQVAVANIQRDMNLTISQREDATKRIIAASNNETQKEIQRLTNQGNIENIKQKGYYDERITQMTNNNKMLLETSNGAAQIYSEAMTAMSAIASSADLDGPAKTQHMNNIITNVANALKTIRDVGISEQALGGGQIGINWLAPNMWLNY
jgi:hypothetical protein